MNPERVIIHHSGHVRFCTGTGIPVLFPKQADNFTVVSGFDVPDFRKFRIHFPDVGNQFMHMQGMDETDDQRCQPQNYT